jgi:hypothetical protein
MSYHSAAGVPGCAVASAHAPALPLTTRVAEALCLHIGAAVALVAFGFDEDDVTQLGHILELAPGLLAGQPAVRDPVLELVGIVRERLPMWRHVEAPCLPGGPSMPTPVRAHAPLACFIR